MAAVLHRAPVVVPIEMEPVRDGGVLVESGRVLAVGPATRWPDVETVRWPGVLIPGLVNAHAHLEYGPSFADLASSGLPFVAWITSLTARRSSMTTADWLADARGSVGALLASGTTTVADIVTIGPGVRAAGEAGLGGTSYLESVAVDATRWPAERARLMAALGAADPERVLGLSPHTLYTLDSATFTGVVGLARELGLRLHTHLAESAEESEFVLAGRGRIADALRRIHLVHDLLSVGAGRTPTAQLDALGGLGPDVHAAHGVHVDAADRALLRERRTPVALCTRSNRILAAGEAPIAAYLREGSPIALGTDSLASSPDLDLLAEASAARDLAGAQGYDEPDVDRRLLSAATRGGAAALGLGDVGVLRPGARADLAAFDVATDGDPYTALIDAGGGHCVGTVLGGSIVWRSGAASGPS